MPVNTLEIIIKSKAKGEGAVQAKGGLDKLAKAAKVAGVAFAAMAAAQKGIEFLRFGAGVQRAAGALDGLAASAGTSGKEIVEAIQGASDYTIDRMTAMEAANKAMLLDVAKSPEQFARLAKVATTLGRAMGQDATKSIDDFVVAAGRQSKQIADNLGLMVGAEKANEKYAKKLGKTAKALTDAEKKQAFLAEMLDQGEKKMGEMGDTGLDTAGQLEQVSTALADLKAIVAEGAAEMVGQTGALEWLSAGLRELPTTINQVVTIASALWERFKPISDVMIEIGKWTPPMILARWLGGAAKGTLKLVKGLGDLVGVDLNAWLATTEAFAESIEEAAAATILWTEAEEAALWPVEELAVATEEQTAASIALAMDLEDLRSKYDPLKMAQEDAARASEEMRLAQEAQTLATQNATLAHMDLAETLMDASQAEIARVAISLLKTTLDEGKISFDEYVTAVTETQLAFGLVTPESQNLATSLKDLVTGVEDGRVKAEDFSGVLQNVTTNMIDLGQEIEDLPDYKTIRVNVEYEKIAGEMLQHGTSFWRGGAAVVGEGTMGGELVMLPRGSRVFDAARTAAMMRRAMRGRAVPPASSGGVRQTWHQQFFIDAAGMSARELAMEIKREERLAGNRQVA